MLRLSHLGWGRYGHGLSSRPRESCDNQFLTPLLNLFGYPDGAVAELFNGTFKASLFLHSFFKEISILVGIYSPGLFYLWLVLVLDSVFIFRIMILF